MGNYFSSQKEESIKIINEVDHVHVIVTNSDSKNEIDEINGLKDETVQDISNNFQVDNSLSDQTKKSNDNDYDYEHDTQLQLQYKNKDGDGSITIYKKNMKKKQKCKKNKKRCLQ